MTFHDVMSFHVNYLMVAESQITRLMCMPFMRGLTFVLELANVKVAPIMVSVAFKLLVMQLSVLVSSCVMIITDCITRIVGFLSNKQIKCVLEFNIYVHKYSSCLSMITNLVIKNIDTTQSKNYNS